MAHLSTVGERDPMLLIQLEPGEAVFAQADAMVSMSPRLKLTAGMHGGILSSLGRKAFGGETFFTQKLTCPEQAGRALLAPMLPGDVLVLDVPEDGVVLNHATFLAAHDTVRLGLRTQGLLKGLFAQTGGLLTMHAKGRGQLAVHGFGHLLELGVDESGLVVDTGHVVCWSASLDYSLGVRTHQRQGILSGLLSAGLTGEGLVTTFRGQGSVWVASRNYAGFAEEIAALASPLVKQTGAAK